MNDAERHHPFTLSLSKGQLWFDKLTTNGLGKLKYTLSHSSTHAHTSTHYLTQALTLTQVHTISLKYTHSHTGGGIGGRS